MVSEKNILLVVPTLNGGALWSEAAASIASQDIDTNCVVVDSGSNDDTVEIAKRYGFTVIQINKSEFSHGATRQFIIDSYPDVDIYVFLTQDAVPESDKTVRTICNAFESDNIGMAYGRQLPRKDANPIEAHARLFNYPDDSRIVSKDDIPRLGIKAAFTSNSFAAYRGEVLKEVGGFPKDIIMGEDVCVAAKMILKGWKIYYVGDARVFHSHKYSMSQELKRYFDIGVFHSRESWIKDAFGAAEGEGMRFITSEIKYLLKRKPLLIFSAFIRTLFKYAGYRMGILERYLPLYIKRQLSMHKFYWN